MMGLYSGLITCSGEGGSQLEADGEIIDDDYGFDDLIGGFERIYEELKCLSIF